MKTILDQLNYSISANPEMGTSLKLLVINNPDGTPRWICNANEKKPIFLKFYASNSARAKVFTSIIKLVFFLRIQKLVFNTEEFFIAKKNSNDEPIINLFTTHWALFTGTVGPNRKFVIYKSDKNNSLFYKIGITPQSIELIKNEANALTCIEQLKPEQFFIPKVHIQRLNTIALEDISNDAMSTLEFTSAHEKFLSELHHKTSHTTNLYNLIKDHHLHGKLAVINKNSDTRIPHGIGRKLNILLNSFSNESLNCTLSHGDFTPWNCFLKVDKLGVYDWELSEQSMPAGFDMFHFFMQKGILTERKSWSLIYKEMKSAFSTPEVSNMFLGNEEAFHAYLKYYLVFNAINYLNTYTQQTHWHKQIHWLINTWNEALSEMLRDVKRHRELLIMDVFDFMNSKNYAAIKFPNIYPEQLSEYSDIDMCIEKNDWKEIKNFLIQHPLIAAGDLNIKSFMSTAQIMLADASFLSIDFIWEFKRKSLVMLSQQEVLKQINRNDFGVKMMSKADTARYLILFYGLNNAIIPVKYRHFIKAITDNENKFDRELIKTMNYYSPDQQKLSKLTNKNSDNKGLSSLKNKMFYLFDSVKQIFSGKGFVITFSGVDGAGKSTIIEKTKHEIEKKMRRKVVVIRHRPSLLPILSAITKGKAKAESEAAQKLPRQGTNFGKVSSLLRFAYYYSDYLFGQFYVYLKYTLRGTVVLYDRYYFDFIVDSRRSNITISEKLVRFGYKFLLKPDLNFFLYADVDTILKRKQELNAATIVELTNKYKKLFFELDFAADHKKLKYESIENIDLRDTISKILMNTITIAA